MSDWLARVVAASAWKRLSLDRSPRPTGLPEDYRALIETLGPGEGFVGDEFLRLFPAEDLSSLSERYGLPEYLPGLLLFGSTGGGEAYAFDTRDGWAVVKTPFVPLDRDYAKRIADNVTELMAGFADTGAPRQRPNPDLWQLEMEFTHPLALGGSPGPENRIFVPLEKHIELVRFWANTFRVAKKKAARSS